MGEKFTVTTEYSGKEAVVNRGGGNYFPVARSNWYPNNPDGSLGEYANYDMTFRIPKGMQIAATGVRLSESNEGGQNVTTWKSEAPQTVAGFSFGRFEVEEAKLDKPPYVIQSYANIESPDWVSSLKHDAAQGTDLPTMGSHSKETVLGSMSTVGLNKKALVEGQLAIQLYTDYFGPPLFTHMQLNAADSLQLRTILARAGLDPDLLLLRHYSAPRTRDGLGRSRILESCDTA